MLLRWPINGENGHSTEVANLMEGEWSCYRGGKFMAGEWSCFRGGHFNGGRKVMLQMWSVLWKENSHFTEVLTLMDICIICCILRSIRGVLLLVYSISYL